MVLYDGSPTYPQTDGLWKVVADHGVALFGAGAGYFLGCAKEELHPGKEYRLDALRGGRLHRFAVARIGIPLDPGRRRPADPRHVDERWNRCGDRVHRRLSTGARSSRAS